MVVTYNFSRRFPTRFVVVRVAAASLFIILSHLHCSTTHRENHTHLKCLRGTKLVADNRQKYLCYPLFNIRPLLITLNIVISQFFHNFSGDLSSCYANVGLFKGNVFSIVRVWKRTAAIILINIFINPSSNFFISTMVDEFACIVWKKTHPQLWR